MLACTHFPLLEDELRAAFGPGVAFVDGAAGIARRIASLTAGQPFVSEPDRTSRCSPDEAPRSPRWPRRSLHMGWRRIEYL